MLRAVGALIICQKTQRAMMQLRSEEERHSMCWGLWGGKLIGNEGDLEGLKRELVEELGHPGVPDTIGISHIYTFTTRNRHFRHVSYAVLCEEEFNPILNNESAGYCWVKLNSWPSPLHYNTGKMFKSRAFKETLKSILSDEFKIS
ncbi:NUDIX hydrolase [bacterium]|jgi:ADP-ribose pyrophosphatase YjhB (NUDIX family)|nr:NUDIX hydrolase [bacterium]|tara:strand:+ start:58 stop:495 length:438 start_codon:yes stop_codon:yes gene_type:complete